MCTAESRGWRIKGIEGEREVTVWRGGKKNKIQFVYSMKVHGFTECMRHRGLVRSESWEVSPRLNDKQEALVTMDVCDVFFFLCCFIPLCVLNCPETLAVNQTSDSTLNF